MSEIEKMYKNAGVSKYGKRQCKDSEYLECQNYCFCSIDNKCDKFTINYPPFTAEKQLELIKWLNLNDKIDCFLSRHNELRNEWVLSAHCVTEFANEEPFIYPGFNKEFSQALAMLINYLWQDLTEEEKQQVKEILE